MTEKNDRIEIDIRRLFGALLKKMWLIGIVSVACALAALIGTRLFVTPQYQSSAMFYVNNNSMSLGDAAVSITSSDITASRGLVKSYIVILKSRETLNDVIDYADVNRTYGEVRSMITAEAVDSTEIFEVVVASPDPKEAEKIADAIAYILPKRISSIIEGTSAEIVESAVLATGPSSPSYPKNAMRGFLLGCLLSIGAVVFWVLLDVTIRTEDDILQNCRYPVLAAVPDMEAANKAGYEYGYQRSSKKQKTVHLGKNPVLIGSQINFAAAEAYKLLRTKIQFSFADDNTSHVIGVTSALSGEGKSLTAINLAYSLSQLGKTVILIDCDMRRPTLAEKLNIKKKPGLSNYLTAQASLEELIQFCGIKGDESAFCVITAGHNPPNPIELLSSERMTKLLKGLREICNYVILDLPPVSEVSDALTVSQKTDGILLVARKDRCNSVALNDAVHQFEFVNAKILGVVYNCTTDGDGKYGKGYYKRYYQEKSGGNYMDEHRKADRKQVKK